MNQVIGPNSRAALVERRAAGVLGWRGPVLMLFARSALAVVAQGLVAAIYAARGSATPWREAGAWLPVYGTLIDLGCLCLLWWLTRREGIALRDLLGFDRKRIRRDLLLGLALIPPSLLFILGGIIVASVLIFGTPAVPQIFGPLPLWAALYSVLVFPLIWGVTEQTVYNGYLLPRFQVCSGSTSFAVAIVALVWSFQHVVMPLSFDPDFMTYRMLSPIPFSIFITLAYLRLRRILPLAAAHWLMDGASAFFSSLWPLLR
jgi:membrane protease YdiL (CAAX protease family)